MNERRLDGFFYGLFMDVAVLRQSGAAPANPRPAYLQDAIKRVNDGLVRAPRSPQRGRRTHPG